MRSEEDLTQAKPLRGPARKVADVVGADAVARGAAARRFVGEIAAAGADPIVAQPSSATEIGQLLLLAREQKLKVFIAGSSARGVRWEAMPEGPSIVLDFTRMDSLVAVDEISMTVTAQAGMTTATLERLLARRGFTLGFALGGFAEQVSIGGLLATGLPPLASPALGTPFDRVVNVRWVMPDGTRVATRVTPRSATGPDLDALALGSRGLIGILSEATLIITRLPEEKALLGFGFQDLPTAVQALGAVIGSGMPPAAAGIWPAAPGAKRGARLAALYGGSRTWTRAVSGAAKKAFKELGARPDPKPDESWFAHVDRAKAQLEGAREPIWAHGSFSALARASAAPALLAQDAGFGIPSFHGSGGYAVAANGPGEDERIAALEKAGCRVLRDHQGTAVPFSAATMTLLKRLKHTLDPDDVLNPGVVPPKAHKEEGGRDG